MDSGSNSSPPQASESPVAPKQPPAWCKWFILAISFTINVLITGIPFSFGILFVELLQEFNQGKGRTAAVGSVAIGIMFGVGPLAGGLSKHLGTRPVAVFGAVLSFISLFVSGFATSLDVLYGTYSILAGIGFGLLNLSAVLCVSEHFGKKMGVACALTSCGCGVGNLVFPIVMNNLIEQCGWRHMLKILSGIQVTAILCSVAMFPQITEGRNICGCKKSSKPDKKPPKKLSIPTLYPNLYSAFKSIVHCKIDGESVKESPVTPPIEEELRNNVDPSLNSVTFTTYSTYDSANPLPSTNEENGGQTCTKCNTPTNSPKAKTQPVRNPNTIDSSSIPEKTFPPDRSRQELNTSTGDAKYFGQQLSNQQPSFSRKFLCYLIVFKNVKYVVFLVSCLLAATGAGVPPIIISDHALAFKVSPKNAAILVSVMGVTGTIGRLLAGLASCFSKTNIIALYMIQMFLSGIATVFTPFVSHYWFIMLFSASFGLFYGVTAGLDPAMLAVFVGSENMAMGYGFFSLALGVGSGISALIAGSLHDFTGNYNCSFYVAGILMISSSICALFLLMLSRTRSKDFISKKCIQNITLIRYQALH